jgi:glycogen debranching enzyme
MLRDGVAVTVLEGSSFFVADDDGNAAQAAEGLFRSDVRHLSRWRMTIDDEVPRLLSTGNETHFAAACFGRVHRREERTAADVTSIRRLVCTADSFQEDVRLVNHGSRTVEHVVRFEFDSDFLDLFEVKSREFGRRDLTFARSITPLLTTRSYDREENVYAFAARGGGFAAQSLIWFSEVGIPGDREVLFPVRIEPRSTWTLQARVVALRSGEERAPTYPDRFFERERRRVRAHDHRWCASAPTLDTDHSGLGAAYDRSVRDLSALAMRTPDDPDRGPVPAAGLPWYAAVFGRDTAIVGMQTLPIAPATAACGLRVLADHQATDDVPEQDAEPGKIPHELRFGKVAALTSSFPYYGTVDATPLFLMLLHEHYRWTGDPTLARELEPAARAALGWIEGPGDPDGDRFLEFHRRSARGLEVQSWKDSWNSQVFADGQLAHAPIAPAEAQGYAYAARLGLAEISREVWADAALAERLERDAAALKVAFDDAFWCERFGWYALALDADKRQVDSLASNIGHLLWTGIAADRRIDRLAALLLDEDLFSGWGIRTVARNMGAYNPVEYHVGTVWPHDTAIACAGLMRYGHTDAACTLFDALIDLSRFFDGRLPEVIAGFARDQTSMPVLYPTACAPQAWAAGAIPMALRAVLGLEPDRRSERLSAPFSGGLDRLALRWRNIRALGRRWDVGVDAGRVVSNPRD